MLQPLKNKSIRLLCLPFCMGMRQRCKISSDTLAYAKTFESVRVKVCAIVGDYAMRNPVSGDDVFDKFDGRKGIKLLDGLGFNPLGKLVDCYQQMSESSLVCSKWSDCIQSPHGEWPSKRNCLQRKRWLVGLV